MDDLIGQDYRTPGEVRAMSNGERHMIRIDDDGRTTFDPDLVVTRDADQFLLTAPWAGNAVIYVSPQTEIIFADGRPALSLFDVVAEAFPA